MTILPQLFLSMNHLTMNVAKVSILTKYSIWAGKQEFNHNCLIVFYTCLLVVMPLKFYEACFLLKLSNCTKRLGIVSHSVELVISCFQIRSIMAHALLIHVEYQAPLLGSMLSCVVETIHLPDRGETFNVNGFSLKL